ncbi:hypothetical protein CK203_055825 [Vitis vinifera]|uniref:Integrase catalytic domain-containing protein n=1 Tax=Vitis vinifera TaxID=29760 RepID=A0A438H6F3_VITVI|nr:hypothetical protein CK203_055825 [Vitis vinifera]
MPLSRAFQKLMEGGLLTPLAPRPAPQLVSPCFRLDLQYQGLVNLGQPSVTTNPLPAYSTHAVPPSPRDIHLVDLIEDDNIHMLSWDDGLPKPIVLHDSSEDTFVPFTLWPEDGDSEGREIHIVTRSGRIAQPPPPAGRPFEGVASHEEVRRKDDEVLRQLQSTQARISIWRLLASSSTHRDALIRALIQIRVKTTTAPKDLIHMLMAGRATCIMFSDDDLPPEGSDHVRPLYIIDGCSGHRVTSVLLDNGSALNVCHLATAIAFGFAPLDFGPSTQIVKAYDSTKKEVMGQPWIHRVGAIPHSLHQKVKFIHDGQVIMIRSTRDMFVSSEPVIQISHSEDDVFFYWFTFDEIQTLKIKDFCRDFVAMSFDYHSSIVDLDMMRGMTFLPGMGLGRRQRGPSEFTAAIDHDTTFGLGFIPTEADYQYMARLRKERVRARLSHTPFNYPIRPYRMSLVDYFVRGSETRPRLEEIDSVVHTNRETELQHLFHQLQLKEITDDGVVVYLTKMIDGVVPHDEYRDQMDMMTVSQITDIVQLQPTSPCDMFRMSTIEILEETQTIPVLDDLIHAPPLELHALTSSWLFSVWGIDIIGKISPKSFSGHEFILVAIDYFTKWVEAASYARLTSARVASFIRYLFQKYGIRHHRSSAYRPHTNGAVEATNKNIKRILRKMVETSRDWSEKLLFALWAYRTSFRTSIGATPYSLVYGMEVVLPVETEMGSLRVALEQQIFETEWTQARFDQLNLLDERRLRAADHV